MNRIAIIFLLVSCTFSLSGNIVQSEQSPKRARDLGIIVGSLKPGRYNAITDVDGVMVGHSTIIEGDDVRTGVTAILPHSGNIFQEKAPAAIYVGNGFGKLAGSTQVKELGNIETPIILTNTLSVGAAVEAVVYYTLQLPGNNAVRSVNAVVGETNDGGLNDIRGMHVKRNHVIDSIESAKSGHIQEGTVGAGTGTQAFGFKGGIGTSSRIVSIGGTPYVVGVLLQSNYGGHLRVNGVSVGRELREQRQSNDREKGDGSCMIVVATDAPLSQRNLERLSKRALFGLARTGSVMSNGSGDYVIAFTTSYRVPYQGESTVSVPPLISNNHMTGLFTAVIDATEEAVYNSMFMAESVTGRDGKTVQAIPIDRVVEIYEKHKSLQ